jgi:hypothetical protein
MGASPVRGIVLRPITREPIVKYARAIQGVPLTGGQASGLVAGTGTQAGVLNPGQFQTLEIVPLPPFGGPVTINWTVTLAGTVGANDVNNFQLVAFNSGLPLGGFLAGSVNAGVDGTYPQATYTGTLPESTTAVALQVKGTTPTGGAIYGGTVTVPGTVTLSVGPQGLGNIWYPVQCVVSTSTGATDTSTCAVYLGSQAQQNLQGGQSYAGGGDTVSLSVQSMSPGDLLIAVWTGAVPGAIAAINVTGTMDALTA